MPEQHFLETTYRRSACKEKQVSLGRIPPCCKASTIIGLFPDSGIRSTRNKDPYKQNPYDSFINLITISWLAFENHIVASRAGCGSLCYPLYYFAGWLKGSLKEMGNRK